MSEDPYKPPLADLPTPTKRTRLKKIRLISAITFAASLILVWGVIALTKIISSQTLAKESPDADTLTDQMRIGLGLAAGIAPIIILSGIITVAATILLWIKSARA